MNGGSTTLTDCSNGPLYFWYMFLHCHNVKNFREHIMSYLIKLAIPMKGGNAKISGCIYLFKSIDHTNYFLLEQDNGKETHQWLTFWLIACRTGIIAEDPIFIFSDKRLRNCVWGGVVDVPGCVLHGLPFQGWHRWSIVPVRLCTFATVRWKLQTKLLVMMDSNMHWVGWSCFVWGHFLLTFLSVPKMCHFLWLFQEKYIVCITPFGWLEQVCFTLSVELH